jgi:hypothetical protein
MTQQENENVETTEKPETTTVENAEASTLERAMESADEETKAEPSLLESAPAAFNEWVSETREVMQRHWGQALERARTRLEPMAKVADEASEVASEEVAEAAEAVESAARTPLHTLLGSAIVTRAQEHGAAILLGSMRKLRAQLETLEANLEAARPDSDAVVA